VHAHLLRDRSDKLKKQVEAAVARSADVQGDRAYITFNALFINESAVRMYLRFLYGQPMWVSPTMGLPDEECPTGELADCDWQDLTQVHELGMYYEDFNAVDAVLDGMRNLLERCRDGLTEPFQRMGMWRPLLAPRGRLLLDYMVHRDCKSKKWIEACGRYNPAQEIREELSSRFAQEARRHDDGAAEPDLMERCRYHLHVEKGTPCYLDK
jgi:hypothetical protein